MTDTRAIIRRLSAAREAPGVTCSASRHAQQIAERLMLRVEMADDRTEHAGESIAATVAALWEARTKIARLEAERDAARADAELYRWLRDLKCCTFTLSRDDDHAVNYMSASDWIDERPEWFKETPAEEIEAMRRANTIWTLRVYPVTPVGFYTWHAATLDAAIRAAMP